MSSDTPDLPGGDQIWFHYILTVQLIREWEGDRVVGDDHCVKLPRNTTEEDMLAEVHKKFCERKGILRHTPYAILFYRCVPDERS